MHVVKIDPQIEQARREVLTARTRAYAAKDWLEVARLTALLQTFPVKTSKGTYVTN